MVDVFSVHHRIYLEVLFLFGSHSLQKAKECLLLMELAEILEIPDRQQEHLDHFLELVVLKVVVVVLDVVNWKLLGKFQLVKHDIRILWFIGKFSLPILSLLENISPVSNHLSSLDPFYQFFILVYVEQLSFTLLYHLKQSLHVANTYANWIALDLFKTCSGIIVVMIFCD